jgi:hypothetical protein
MAAVWQLSEKIDLSVAFVAWEVFRDIMLETLPTRRNDLIRKTTAIIGGIDLNLETE